MIYEESKRVNSSHLFLLLQDLNGDDKWEDDSKDRRRSRKKHRKSEDIEKRDKRRKRHKHRHCRSPSDSGDAIPSVDGSKHKVDSDDGAKKGAKKKSRRSRSASLSNSGSY